MNSTDIDTTPVFLENVTVEGGETFNAKFLKNVISPLLTSQTQTIASLVSEGNKVLQQLTFLGNFTNAALEFDVDNAGERQSDEFGNKLTNVVGKVQLTALPRSHIRIKNVHNDVYNYIDASYSNRNAFGNGENITIDSKYNFRNFAQDLNVYISKPTKDTSVRLFGEFSNIKTNDKLYQCAHQSSSGFQFGVMKQKYCGLSGSLTTVTGGVNIVNRNMHHVDDSANDEVKIYAGESLKSSVFVNLLSTNMKYLTSSLFKMPVNGFSIGLNNELAGMGASSSEDKFFKSNVNVDIVRSVLGDSLTMMGNFKMGGIYNFEAVNGGTVHFQDKFYPVVSGYDAPLMPLKSVGAGGFVSYNFGVATRAGLIHVDNPIRVYYSVNGCAVGDEVKSLGDWKHGVDVGLIYCKGENSARLAWKKSLESDSVGKFGFEVDIAGEL